MQYKYNRHNNVINLNGRCHLSTTSFSSEGSLSDIKEWLTFIFMTCAMIIFMSNLMLLFFYFIHELFISWAFPTLFYLHFIITMAKNDSDLVPTYCCNGCNNAYDDPRILSCLHFFSFKCLKDMATNAVDSSFLICPLCGCQTFIPNGIEGLQCHVRLNRTKIHEQVVSKIMNVPSYCNSCEANTPEAVCMDCEDFLCSTCWTAHQQLKKSRSHYSFTVKDTQEMTPDQLLQALPASYTSPPPTCVKHEGQKVDLYCQKCSSLICLKCSVVDHKDHQVYEMKKYTSQCKTILGHTLEKISKAQCTLSELSTSVSITLERIKSRHKELDSSIKESFSQLYQLLHQREELLSSKVSDIAEAKETALSAQIEGIQKLLQPLADLSSIGSTAISEYTDVEMLSVARTIEERAISLQEQYAETPLEICESSNIPAEVDNKSLVTMVTEFGRVSSTSPSNSIAILPRHSITLGAEMTVTVIPKNNKQQQVEDSGLVVSSRLISNNKEKLKIDCPVIENEDGTFSVIVKPTQSGWHDFAVTVHSQHISGSPFGITVAQRRDYKKVQKPLKVITGIEYPRCIAFAPNGDMFVTSDNHCVYVYDTGGKKKGTIGSQGRGELQFESPHGIAISGHEVYVAEYGGDRIHKFTTSGSFISTFGDYGDDVGCFNNPHDVEISPSGKIFIADTDNCRIQVFNTDWSFIQVIDGKNLDQGSFKGPMGLAFDLLGNLLVTEHECHSLTVLSPNGKFLKKYNHSNMTYPAGIAVDAAGYALVVNYNPGSLSIFDNCGTFVHSVRGFNYPFDVAVSAEGCVWIADYYNKRLLKY